MTHGADRWRSTVAAGRIPFNQAAEIARLRRELDLTRMERDVLTKAIDIPCVPATGEDRFSLAEKRADEWHNLAETIKTGFRVLPKTARRERAWTSHLHQAG